jgi:hypothetical protein
MPRRLWLAGICMAGAVVLTARDVQPGGPMATQGASPLGGQNSHFPEPTPMPAPPADFHGAPRPSFDPAGDSGQNHDPKTGAEQAADAGPTAVKAAGPAPSPVAAAAVKPGAVRPAAVATPDIEALGGLLDRVSRDQEALASLLAGRPSLDSLSTADRSKAEAILADRDLAEQTLLARLRVSPMPVPDYTPSSAGPLATPTPIP